MLERVVANATEATVTRSAPDPSAAGVAPRPPFAELARVHLDRLYGYCLRLTSNPADAEDLVQETLLHGMRAYDDLRDPERAKGWLFAIATNAWRDLVRSRGRELPTTSLDDLDHGADEFSLFQTIAIEDPFPYSDELHLDFLRLFRDEDVRDVFGSITPVFRLPLILNNPRLAHRGNATIQSATDKAVQSLDSGAPHTAQARRAPDLPGCKVA